MTKFVDGYMPFMEYRTYYKIFGSAKSKKPPVLILHGGPGSAHNYLLGLSDLTKSGRQIVFYDQLGSGMSSKPLNQNIWNLELFVTELAEIRRFLHLDNVVLFGHSWGGMLAAEYICSRDPGGVEKIIFASSMLSMPLYRREVELLKKDLPAEIYTALLKHEKAGTTNSEQYKKAVEVYEKHFVFRGDHFPPELRDPRAVFGEIQYEKLWGPSEAFANGSLKNWSRLEDLHDIRIPALVISGQYDELTPAQAVATLEQLPDAKIEIITAGSHLAHIEHPDRYLSALKNFLD